MDITRGMGREFPPGPMNVNISKKVHFRLFTTKVDDMRQLQNSIWPSKQVLQLSQMDNLIGEIYARINYGPQS